MALSILALSLLSILLAAGIRYHDVGMRHAAPFGLTAGLWFISGLLCLGLLARQAWVWRRSGTNGRPHQKSLLLVPGLLFLLWAWYPSSKPGAIHLAVLMVILAGLGFGAWRDPDRAAIWGSRREFRGALRLLAPVTLALAAAALGLWFRDPTELRYDRILISLLSYPLYAILQLSLFFGLTESALRRIGASRAARILTPAALFSLAHWPNGWLMLATGSVGLLWAGVYQRHRSLPALALSMGILATVFTQFLPREITSHARVGPGYVFKAHIHELLSQAAEETGRLSEEEFVDQVGPGIQSYVSACFEGVLKRKPLETELSDWRRGWYQAWRARTSTGILLARNQDLGWDRDEEQLRVLGEAWSSEEIWGECGEDWTSWLARFFSAEAGREMQTDDALHWPAAPDLAHRRALVRALQRTTEYANIPGSPAWACARLGPWLPPHEEFRARWPGPWPEFRLSQRMSVSRPTKLRNAGSDDSTE